jgi:hypothetical protein
VRVSVRVSRLERSGLGFEGEVEVYGDGLVFGLGSWLGFRVRT